MRNLADDSLFSGLRVKQDASLYIFHQSTLPNGNIIRYDVMYPFSCISCGQAEQQKQINYKQSMWVSVIMENNT